MCLSDIRRTAARSSVNYAGHYALGPQAEIRLFKERLEKRGQYSHMRYLGLDHEGDSPWALDLCSKSYAIWSEERRSSEPEKIAQMVETTASALSGRGTSCASR